MLGLQLEVMHYNSAIQRLVSWTQCVPAAETPTGSIPYTILMGAYSSRLHEAATVSLILAFLHCVRNTLLHLWVPQPADSRIPLYLPALVNPAAYLRTLMRVCKTWNAFHAVDIYMHLRFISVYVCRSRQLQLAARLTVLSLLLRWTPLP